MTTANKRDEVIVLGALPASMVKLSLKIMKFRESELLVFDAAAGYATRAVQRLQNAGKIRYNRSAMVWEKCE